MTAATADLTLDAFLCGALKVLQPRTGYRAATDPVLLAAACPARAGETVLELGCGVGVAALCLAHRSGALITGVEQQPRYAALARENAATNNVPLCIYESDLTALPQTLVAQSFDHVIANPPYAAATAGTPARDTSKDLANREKTPLADWIDIGLRRLKPKGRLTVIHLAERLSELLANLEGRAGDIHILPLAPRAGHPASRVILRARKGAKSPFKLLAPVIIHQGTAHTEDRESYSPVVKAVLRDGEALHF